MARTRTTRVRKLVRPAADETCSVALETTKSGVQLKLWACSAPAPTNPSPAGALAVAPVVFVEKIGRRKRRIFYVSVADTREETSLYDEPGWYVETVNPPLSWINPAAFGPYKTLDDLYDDAREAYACEEE